MVDVRHGVVIIGVAAAVPEVRRVMRLRKRSPTG